jgi:hypothetical protein
MSNKDDFEVIEDDDVDDEKDPVHFEFSWHDSSSWSWGVVLILLGAVFLLRNMGIDFLRVDNWWAIFILAPGLNMMAKSLKYFRAKNRFSKGARTRGLLGLILSAFAVSLLFGIDMVILGPVLLVGFGIYLLLKK